MRLHTSPKSTSSFSSANFGANVPSWVRPAVCLIFCWAMILIDMKLIKNNNAFLMLCECFGLRMQSYWLCSVLCIPLLRTLIPYLRKPPVCVCKQAAIILLARGVSFESGRAFFWKRQGFLLETAGFSIPSQLLLFRHPRTARARPGSRLLLAPWRDIALSGGAVCRCPCRGGCARATYPRALHRL